MKRGLAFRKLVFQIPVPAGKGNLLRAHGVEGNKAIHTLRKEAGAIVATRDGIFAASQFLRHADIATTAAHYADKKTRTVIDMGALLDEDVLPFILPTADQKETRDGCQTSKAL